MMLWVESRREGHGDADAFDLLWQRHSEATYQTIVRVLGPHSSLADEIFQDAWLEVIRAQSYRPGSFRGFMRTVATRKALDKLAAASVRTAAVDRPPLDDRGENRLPRTPAPDHPVRDAEAREGVRVVLDLVAQMPATQRIAWMLHYVEELTFDELAQAMGTPIGTAKTRIRLANAFLARSLEERGIDAAQLVDEP